MLNSFGIIRSKLSDKDIEFDEYISHLLEDKLAWIEKDVLKWISVEQKNEYAPVILHQVKREICFCTVTIS